MRYEVRTGYEKCKRIVQLLENRRSNSGLIKEKDIKILIYQVVGTDIRTVRKYISLLSELGYLKRVYHKNYVLRKSVVDDLMF